MLCAKFRKTIVVYQNLEWLVGTLGLASGMSDADVEYHSHLTGPARTRNIAQTVFERVRVYEGSSRVSSTRICVYGNRTYNSVPRKTFVSE